MADQPIDVTDTALDQLDPGCADPPGTWRKLPIPVRAVRMRVPFRVRTLEGDMTGQAGDYLVAGNHGDRWPVRRDIFEATYEPARFARGGLIAGPDGGDTVPAVVGRYDSIVSRTDVQPLQGGR